MNWQTNLPPGCSSREIETRGDPDVDANDGEPCDHEWEHIDASFDHEFGTEQIHYNKCKKCGEETKASPFDRGIEE